MSLWHFDISIVLNLHNEANYLRRTFLALEESARYTRSRGISVELVVVLDRASAATRAWIDAYDFSAFDAFQIIKTDNGSLGPSRNDGIRVARGEYIATADGDDLISYNIYFECYEKLARKAPRPSSFKSIIMALETTGIISGGTSDRIKSLN